MLQRVMSRFSIFCRIFFVSQCRKYSQVNPSVLCFRKFPVAKKFMDKRGEYQDFPSRTFCLTVPKISVGESFTVALISGSEKVYGQEGEGVSRFSIENFLSRSAENLRRESFTIALISGPEKVWIRGGGEYQDIPSKIFCLTVPKRFVGESFSISINLGIKKC